METRFSWRQRGLAALAVSALGVGVAGSVALTGAAQSTAAAPAVSQPTVVTQFVPGVKVPDAFAARNAAVTRGNARPPVAAAIASGQVAAKAAQAEAAVASATVNPGVDPVAVDARATAMASAAASVEKQDAALVAKRKAAIAKAKAAANKGCNPVKGSYTIAARFGDVGVWARYHTGFDFAAPIGRPLRAPTAGTVMNAGRGSAARWAGNYVVIKQADGTQVLMAHMSRVDVKVGQKVSACDPVGAVGQTGPRVRPAHALRGLPEGHRAGRRLQGGQPAPMAAQDGHQAVVGGLAPLGSSSPPDAVLIKPHFARRTATSLAVQGERSRAWPREVDDEARVDARGSGGDWPSTGSGRVSAATASPAGRAATRAA